MKRTILVAIWCLLCCTIAMAQEPQKSELQQRAEAANAKNDIALARSSYIRAYEDYVRQSQWQQAVECGTKATALYYKENFYQEAFDLLRRIDQNIADAPAAQQPALRYLTTKERLQMYMKMKRGANALEQLNAMERYAIASGDEHLAGDLLYTKTIYYYTFGQNEKGNAVFKEMVSRLTASGEYDKVVSVYQTLIDNGRKAGSASLVAQAYSSYIVWKDSVYALQRADETAALKAQIADNEAAIAERDSSLATRKGVIAGLTTLPPLSAMHWFMGSVHLSRAGFTRSCPDSTSLICAYSAMNLRFSSSCFAPPGNISRRGLTYAVKPSLPPNASRS